MFVLALETAGDKGGAALLSPGGQLFEATFFAARQHGELLPGCVQAVLRAAGIKPRELGLVAVDIGPGSFTGLRIGIAFAQALAQAHDLPTVGVRQTEALGMPVARWWPGRVAVWIHDRRQFVYHAWARGDRAGRESVLSVSQALEKLAGESEVLVVGSGALRFAADIRRAVPRAVVAEGLAWPSPADIAQLGRARFEAQGAGPLEPLYLQPPVGNAKEV
ncbi:MAG TPA: tRNA (adenosine(37)-N6)-threonylcarbamoyltransferase complex dimerization subunit type 1 TsaB [Candidatus Acetothermia bacterium]|nr:tRNA (adenosine(37)-N6)-threonylcarbamoyltransferase complex dimerization subunit type 1 TsaB [Candidatus Acetothermia bacterium]